MAYKVQYTRGKVLRCVIWVGFLLYLSALPSGVHANVPLPSQFSFVMPSFLMVLTWGAAFVGIVIIEAIVLKWGLGLPIGRALRDAVLINFLSSLFGAANMLGSLMIFVVIFVSIWIYSYSDQHWKMGKLNAFLLALILPVLTFGWAISMRSIDQWLHPWFPMVSLLAAFCLTVYIETLLGWRLHVGWKNISRTILIANGFSYLFLVGCLLVLNIEPGNNLLITMDRLHLTARKAAREEKVEQVREAFALIKRDFDEFSSYDLESELKIARVLIDRDQEQLAQDFIAHVKKHLPGEQDKKEELENRIGRLEERLSEKGPE